MEVERRKTDRKMAKGQRQTETGRECEDMERAIKQSKRERGKRGKKRERRRKQEKVKEKRNERNIHTDRVKKLFSYSDLVYFI